MKRESLREDGLTEDKSGRTAGCDARPLRAILIASAAVAVVLLLVNRVQSGSVDFAHHYALVAYIAEHLKLPAYGEPSLREMSFYPPASHILAATVGRILGSPLLGLQVTALLSLAMLWAAIGAWFSTLPDRLLTPFFTAFFGLALGALWIGFDMHGAEIVGNFLFSQLVAQAAAIGVLALTARYARCRNLEYPWIGLILVIAAPVLSNVHLLPGLAILGTFGIGGLTVVVAERRGLRGVLAVIGLTLASLAAIVISPAFQAMRKLSENNGSLQLAFVSSQSRVLLLSVLVIAASALLARWWVFRCRDGTGRRDLAGLLLAAYGASLAFLCIVQAIALALGAGSDYAVRKYAFGVQTVLVLDLALLFAMAIQVGSPNLSARSAGSARALLPAIVSSAVVLVMLWPVQTVIELSKLMTAEAFISSYRRTALADAPGKNSYAIDMLGPGTVFNYMFSISPLRAPREPIGMNILLGQTPVSPEIMERVFTAVGSTWDSKRCRVATNADGYAVVDAKCALTERLPCEGEVDFTNRGWLPLSALRGFGQPWEAGRWTVKPSASLICSPRRAGTTVHLFAYGFVAANHSQRLIVSVDGVRRLEALFSSEGEEKELVVPLPDSCKSECRIDFSMPDATSPAALGLSVDSRTLGVGIRRIVFQ